MSGIRINVLGPARLDRDGVTIPLAPLTIRLLVRLVVAEGEAVPIPQLRKDVWDTVDRGGNAERRGHNEVQKRIFELRKVLSGPEMLRTEQAITGPRPTTAYRLVLGPEHLDSLEFTQLVRNGLESVPTVAERLLTEAVALWRGQPLAEASDTQAAQSLIRRLNEMYRTARAELIRTRLLLGRPDLALPIAELLAVECSDDPSAARLLAEARRRVRNRHGDVVLRHDLPNLHTSLTIVRGDLFDQDDANLVVGFSDTFDIATGEDVIISRSSIQGQLVERLFDGEAKTLDRELKRVLRTVAPTAVEPVQDKPRGKRVRYPIGTVVPIPHGGRRIFATAYSRLGNDLVARSDPTILRFSLDRLWASIDRYGMLKPVAIPLVGSGLARVVQLDREQLVATIIESFIEACDRLSTVTPELRVVLQPQGLERTDLVAIERQLAGEISGHNTHLTANAASGERRHALPE